MHNRTYKRLLFIIGILIIILLLLTKCSWGRKAIDDEISKNLSTEMTLLQEMKRDEEVLLSLYERSDFCSKEWIEDFEMMATKFQDYHYSKTITIQRLSLFKDYHYSGEYDEINQFLVSYDQYGIYLQTIAHILNMLNE